MKKFFQEGIIQFFIIMVISWILIYFLPSDLFFTKYLPSSFSWLFWLVILAVVGRGWPGSAFAQKSPVLAGMTTTGTWLILSILTTLFITNVWPGVPLFPVAIWFGIILFATTLWYAFVWGAFPFGKLSAGVNVLIGAVIVFFITGLLWKLLVNLNGTPWEKAAFNPHGLFSGDYTFGLMVWVIAWMLISAFDLQHYPFYKLGQPVCQLIVTVLVIILGYFTWSISTKYISPTSSIAIGGSIIGWSLFFSTLLAYYPFTKLIQPKRGLFSLIVIAFCVIIWIPLLQLILSPVYTKEHSAGLPFDLSQVIVIYTLHVIPILALVHNFFWSRIPFQPAGPPIGPEEAIMDDMVQGNVLPPKGEPKNI
jgi:hypothetical protein